MWQRLPSRVVPQPTGEVATFGDFCCCCCSAATAPAPDVIPVLCLLHADADDDDGGGDEMKHVEPKNMSLKLN